MKNAPYSTQQEGFKEKVEATFNAQVREELTASSKQRTRGWWNIAMGAVLLAATITLFPTVATLTGAGLVAGSLALGTTALMGVFLGVAGHSKIRTARQQYEKTLNSYKVAQVLLNDPIKFQDIVASVDESAVESQQWRDKILATQTDKSRER